MIAAYPATQTPLPSSPQSFSQILARPETTSFRYPQVPPHAPHFYRLRGPSSRLPVPAPMADRPSRLARPPAARARGSTTANWGTRRSGHSACTNHLRPQYKGFEGALKPLVEPTRSWGVCQRRDAVSAQRDLHDIPFSSIDCSPQTILVPAASGQELPLLYVQRLSADGVRMVQTRLKAITSYRGAVDGTWGSASQSALRSFQAASGLTADGRLTRATVQALGNDPSTIQATQ